jgi:prolyl oligopeptidase
MPIQYPPTRKDDTVVDDYHGTKVSDPYRWLEDDNAPETAAWVEAQNKVTDTFLNTIPYREAIRENLTRIFNYPRQSPPYRVGEYLFIYRNDGLQNQSPLFIQKGLDGEPTLYLDPNALSGDGTVTAYIVSNSPDDKLAVIRQAASGSDWGELYLKTIPDGRELSDRIRWIKFTGVAWHGDGFFYTGYPAPEPGKELVQESLAPTIYFHKLGTDQSEDVAIFSDPENPRCYLDVSTLKGGEHLFLSLRSGTSGEELRHRRLDQPDAPFQTLFPGFKYDYSLLAEIDGRLYIHTNDNAPNFRVIAVDLANPAQCVDIVPESNLINYNAHICGKHLLVIHLADVTARLSLYDLEGRQVREIPLPGLGSAGGFNGDRMDPEVFLSYSSMNDPGSQYRFDAVTAELSLYRPSQFRGRLDNLVVKQEFCVSKDGTRVPMFILHRADITPNGDLPTQLYGYGGFTNALTPDFAIASYFFAQQGGVYVIANLRGGCEYGEEWHRQGMLKSKHKVFEDFIACAEHLISAGYTNPSRLSIRGGSNGGLLTGACMNLRPDLFAAVVSQVGVMDMLRYQKFTVGWGWIVEYGSSEDPEMFDYLLGYSPYHNLKPDVAYPATLITTADHDDRVAPSHSFKYAARLQVCQTSEAPVLIRIETKSGHGASSLTKSIDLMADVAAFLMDRLGMEFQPEA